MKNAFEYEAELAALREERDQWRSMVGHICATIPLSDVLESADTGQKTVDYFKSLQQRLADAERRNAVMHDLLMRSKEWMAAADCHVLQVAIDEFSGVIGDNAERLQVTFPALMDDIRAALRPTESGASE